MSTEPQNPSVSVFEEIDAIEKLLEPLKGSESDSLRAELQDKTNKLEALNENELSSNKFLLLKREISRLRKNVERLAATPLEMKRADFLQQITDIETTLNNLGAKNSDDTKPEQQKLLQEINTLKADVPGWKTRLASATEKELLATPNSIADDLEDIRKRTNTLATRSFLIHEIELIGKIMNSARVGLFRRKALTEARNNLENLQKADLATSDERGLASFRSDVSRLKERVDTLIIRPRFATNLRSASVLIALSLVPIFIVVYMSSLALWQRDHQKEIHEIATMTASAMPSPTLTATGVPNATPTLAP